MTRERNDGGSERARRQTRRNVAPIWKGVAALVGALFVAIATAIGTGLGSGITHQLEGAPKLLSYSAKPAIAQCGTQLFIPGRRGSTGHLAVSPDWASVMRDNGGGIASPSVTTVSIQGETSRPVTLTDIKFGTGTIRCRGPRPDAGASHRVEPRSEWRGVRCAKCQQADSVPLDRVADRSALAERRRHNEALLLRLACRYLVAERREIRRAPDRRRRSWVCRRRPGRHSRIPRRKQPMGPVQVDGGARRRRRRLIGGPRLLGVRRTERVRDAAPRRRLIVSAGRAGCSAPPM
jgi:hypothetical protein